MPETNPIAALSEEFAAIRDENHELRESLDAVMLSLRAEDIGWTNLFGNADSDKEGLTLEQVKEASARIRPKLLGSSLVARGANLHIGYVWSKGVQIEGTAGGGRGAPSAARKFFTNPVNRKSLFSPAAQAELQRTRYSDGNIFAMVDTSTKRVRLIPLYQVTSIRVNPDDVSELWAIQRTWNPDPLSPTSKEKVVWYYTSDYTGVKRGSITENNETNPTDLKQTIVYAKFNSQSGWALGSPDALPALPWIESYGKFLQYGQVVSESRARLLFKVTSKSRAGAAAAGAKVADMTGYGKTASLVEGQSIDVISGSEKGFEFNTGNRLAGMAASSLNVPLMELLSDSSAASSSYGAANALTPATLNAMIFMQDEWIEFFQRLFEVCGMAVPLIWFDPVETPEPYRAMQSIVLGSVALSDEEFRGEVLDSLNIVGDPKKIPATLSARNIDSTPVQAASPDQGQSNGTGGQGSINDQRTDTISQALSMMNLDRLEELVERMERAQG